LPSNPKHALGDDDEIERIRTRANDESSIIKGQDSREEGTTKRNHVKEAVVNDAYDEEVIPQEDHLMNKISSSTLIYLRGSNGSIEVDRKLIEKAFRQETQQSIKDVIIFHHQDRKGILIHLNHPVKPRDLHSLTSLIENKNHDNETMKWKIFAGNDLEMVVGDDIFINMLSDPVMDEEMSLRRFTDNEELKYSLRSLEKFVPWIRNVIIGERH
jgi:hypothetical protein